MSWSGQADAGWRWDGQRRCGSRGFDEGESEVVAVVVDEEVGGEREREREIDEWMSCAHTAL